jgi:predicted glycoside hydrolase/deacetylase ChbG (UPF0249 family)
LKSLIVNADDFGLDEDVSSAVLEAMERGAVTSTSAMVCTAGGLPLLAKNAGPLRGRVGVHLQLTGGTPRSRRADVPSLVQATGSFPASRRELAAVRAEEIETEWRAQIEAFVEASGYRPAHIDSHQHVHKHPAAFAAYCRVAADYGLRARSCDDAMTRALRSAGIRCADGFECGWTGRLCTVEELLRRIEGAFRACGGSGIIEVMCHPGHEGSRGRELAALLDPALAGKLRERGIRLEMSTGPGN